MQAQREPAPRLRATGFRPDEISALLNRPVVQEHASEAAFLWQLRDSAARGPFYRLKHLALLDRRLEAHLQGVLLAGPLGWRCSLDELQHGEPGAVFLLTWLAFSHGEPGEMRHAVQLALAEDRFQDACVAALAWLDTARVREPLTAMLASTAAPLQRLAVAAMAAHQLDPGHSLGRLCAHPDGRLRARALRAIGEFKRHDLRPQASSCLQDQEPLCRFWAAWSLCLLGEPHAGNVLLDQTVEAPGLVRLAIETAMRCLPVETAKSWIRQQATHPPSRRRAILAVGALGDPAAAEWLLEQMQDPDTARLAGESFEMLAGADIDWLGAKLDAPPQAPDDGPPEDEGLPWPDPSALREWWSREQPRFRSGQRHLVGQPITDAHVVDVLRSGWQRQRRAAALEFALRRRNELPFPVLARADRQQRRMAA